MLAKARQIDLIRGRERRDWKRQQALERAGKRLSGDWHGFAPPSGIWNGRYYSRLNSSSFVHTHKRRTIEKEVPYCRRLSALAPGRSSIPRHLCRRDLHHLLG